MRKSPQSTKPEQHSLLPALSGTGASQLVLKTPQSLVHISHTVNQRQYKIWLVVCASFLRMVENSKNTPTPDIPQRISVLRSELNNIFTYDIGFQYLKEDLEALRVAPLHFNILDKDGMGAFKAAGFISEFVVASNRIEVVLPTPVREAIIERSDTFFSLISWRVLHAMPGKYESIIYKLCNDYRGIGYTPVFEFEDGWREYTGTNVIDLSTGKLPLSTSSDLIRYTLTQPIARINQNKDSDLEISLEQNRHGRGNRLHSFRFRIQVKKNAALNNFDELFSKAMTPIPISLKAKATATLSSEEIALSIERANEFINDKKSRGEDVEPGAIYTTALNNNWGKEVLSSRRKKVEKTSKKRDEELKKQDEEKVARLEARKADFIRIKTKATLDELTAEEFYQIAVEFAASEPGILLSASTYNTDDRRFKSAITQVKFLAFTNKNFKYDFVQSEFEEWLSNQTS